MVPESTEPTNRELLSFRELPEFVPSKIVIDEMKMFKNGKELS